MLYVEQNNIEISPVALNQGEHVFVEDLQHFHRSDTVFFADKELYLLRNRSKGHGVGFFEAGNFFPDFILWLIVGNLQLIVFVDPKGILNLAPHDPKIQFFKTIKDIEKRLDDASVILHSYILSNTPFHKMQNRWGMGKKAMHDWHILFQEEDDKYTYIGEMLREISQLDALNGLKRIF